MAFGWFSLKFIGANSHSFDSFWWKTARNRSHCCLSCYAFMAACHVIPTNEREKITEKKTRHTSTTHSLMLYILQWIMQNGTHLLKIRKEFFSRSFSLESVRLRHITSLLVIFNRPTKLESDCDSKFFSWFRMSVVMNGSLKNEGKKHDLSSMSKWLGSTN